MSKGKHVKASAPCRSSRRRRNRRPLALIVSLALVLVLAVGGTIAYLMDSTDPVVNVFEPTDVKITVDENLSNNVKSNVCITNTGSIDAYVRVVLVANYVDADGNVCALHDGVGLPTVNSPWVQQGGFYYYPLRLASGESTSAMFDPYTLAGAEDGCGVQLEVIASAIQADPASAVTEAWGYTPGA